MNHVAKQPPTSELEHPDVYWDKLKLAKDLVRDAEKKYEVILLGRQDYYRIFGRESEQLQDLDWAKKVINRCEQIKDRYLELYYAAEKEMYNE